MPRIAIELSYDGTAYHGWQRQPNASSVQQVLEEQFSRIFQEDISIMGCGRTDTGVHARHFIAHFDAEAIPGNNLIFRLNNMLPGDISIHKLYEVHPKFHARFDATERSYSYYISTEKDAFSRFHRFTVYRKLDLNKMNDACVILKKHVDFGAFCKSKSQNKTNRCEIQHALWTQHVNLIRFDITADRFLRNMVRAIVGTMIEVGENKLTLSGFDEVIQSQNREQAGYSVPARGLFLEKVVYNQENWKEIDSQ